MEDGVRRGRGRWFMESEVDMIWGKGGRNGLRRRRGGWSERGREIWSEKREMF